MFFFDIALILVINTKPNFYKIKKPHHRGEALKTFY